MWLEIAALRSLETSIRANYGGLDPKRPILSHIYAPDCVGRLNDSIGAIIPRLPIVIAEVVTLRVVILAAAFEAYFEGFLADYLSGKAKYSSGGTLTAAGLRVHGNVMKQRGPKARIEQFTIETGSKTKGVSPHVDAIEQVYALRNCVAHDAAICDAVTNKRVTLVPTQIGARLEIAPEALVTVLAPPCMSAADHLDRRI
jgi:hypothetical protein